MGNKLNSKARKKEISARKKLRKSKSRRSVVVPIPPQESASAPTVSKSGPKKLANPLKGTLQFMKNCSKRSRIALERAERMKQWHERRALEKQEAQDRLPPDVSGDVSFLMPIMNTAAVTNEMADCSLDDTIGVPTPSSKVHAPKRRQTRRRPAFYRPWSQTKNAVYKRFRRGQKMLNPFLRQIAKVVPIHHEKVKPTLGLKASLKMSTETTSRKYSELAKLKVVVPVRKKDAVRRRMFATSGYVPIDDPEKKITGMWRTLRRTITELLLVTDFAQTVERVCWENRGPLGQKKN